MIYVASPYTKHPRGRRAAAHEAAEATAAIMKRHHLQAYCPVAHGYALEEADDYFKDRDAHFWLAENMPFMEASDAIVVVMMESWQDSEGIKLEVDWFREEGKTIYYYNPGEPSLRRDA